MRSGRNKILQKIKNKKNDKNFYEKSVYTHPVKGGQNDIKFRQKKSVFQV